MLAPIRLRRSRSIFARLPEDRETASLSPVVRLSIQTAVRELDRRFPRVLASPDRDAESADADSGDDLPVSVGVAEL
jgi:hypothetical protein